jgi:hypothetical protein
MVWLQERQDPPGNPLDILEELVGANEWPFQRASDCELMVEIQGHWCCYYLYFVWRDDLSAVLFTCQFDQKVPAQRLGVVYELLARVNEIIWMGHFNISIDDGLAMFRHTVPLRGMRGASAELMEDMIDSAVGECERFYPALQMVLWGGRSVEEALQAALMETQGEA